MSIVKLLFETCFSTCRTLLANYFRKEDVLFTTHPCLLLFLLFALHFAPHRTPTVPRSVVAFDGEELEWFLKFLYNVEYNTIV